MAWMADGVGFGNRFLPESLEVENDHFGDSTRLPGPCFPLNNDSGSGKLPFKYVVTRKSL